MSKYLAWRLPAGMAVSHDAFHACSGAALVFGLVFRRAIAGKMAVVARPRQRPGGEECSGRDEPIAPQCMHPSRRGRGMISATRTRQTRAVMVLLSLVSDGGMSWLHSSRRCTELGRIHSYRRFPGQMRISKRCRGHRAQDNASSHACTPIMSSYAINSDARV
jgi:hypothetical protein